MSEKQQSLVLAIIDFLNQSIQDGTVKQDDKEGLEVAVQCIGEAFGVDPDDKEQVKRLSIKPATLSNVFEVFLKTRSKLNQPSASSSTPASSSTSTKPDIEPAGWSPKKATDAEKAEAEKLKTSGNSFMSSKQYDKAIEEYTKAIDLDGNNAVYFSNRAAAYSSKGEHSKAVDDAQAAIRIDPLFTKGYNRLGHGYYCLGNYSEAASAYRAGLELEPSNASLKTGLTNSEARIRVTGTGTGTPTTASTSPERGERSNATDAAAAGAGAGAGLGGLADLMSGLGGGGGGGGMPDIASMMQNPMYMQMAQQLMANGGMERLMENPALANMMGRMQSGQGMPSMAELMSDPSLRDIAQQFMGGAGRGAGGAA